MLIILADKDKTGLLHGKWRLPSDIFCNFGVGWLAKLAAFEKQDILLTYFVISHLTKCEITFYFFCFPFGVYSLLFSVLKLLKAFLLMDVSAQLHMFSIITKQV